MTEYIREMSIGEIVRNAATLHKRNFVTFFFVFAVGFAPVQAIAVFILKNNLELVGFAIYLLIAVTVQLIVCCAMTIAVSDACTGNRPSFSSSYRHLFSTVLLQLLLTIGAQLGLSALIAILASLIFLKQSWFILWFALTIPILIVGAWVMLAPVVVVIEKVGAFAALRRSKTLGKGFYIRNLSFVAFALIFIGVLNLACSIAATVFWSWIGVDKIVLLRFIIPVQSALLSAVFYPYAFTMVVLMYYDLRARKENYDRTPLIEDMQPG
jgi:hypothetical protein